MTSKRKEEKGKQEQRERGQRRRSKGKWQNGREIKEETSKWQGQWLGGEAQGREMKW